MKNKIKSKFSFKFAGLAGDGSMVAGSIISKLAQRSNYFVFDYREYPSAIRGLKSSYQATIASKKIYSQNKKIDLLVILDKKSGLSHIKEMNPEGLVIYDSQEKLEIKTKGLHLIPFPISDILTDIKAPRVMRNIIAVGALTALLNFDLKILLDLIESEFKNKEIEILEMNERAAKNGYAIAKNKLSAFRIELEKGQAREQIFLTGNEAMSLGMIKAGCKFYSAYPMTPVTPILHYLAKNGPKYEIIVKQAEDEISVINMALGAAYAGARAAVATSGGGFCLMTEAFSMAGMTETPLVVIMGTRGNPSTGMPTWTEQSDLRLVLNAGQGEFPRIILAPGDVEEAFYLVAAAFNLAEIYQTPVAVLTDKYLGESRATIKSFEEDLIKIDRGKLNKYATKDYKRYKITGDGISPRAFPGNGPGLVLANSDEHDEYGFSCEGSKNRKQQMEKRMNKLEHASRNLPHPEIYGPRSAENLIISWGSTKGPILEAMKKIKGTKFLHLNLLWPFPKQVVTKALVMAKRIVAVENNYTGQLTELIRQETGIEIENKFLKYDGRAFYPEEIIDFIENKI